MVPDEAALVFVGDDNVYHHYNQPWKGWLSSPVTVFLRRITRHCARAVAVGICAAAARLVAARTLTVVTVHLQNG